MILRIFRAQVVPGEEDNLSAFLRDEAIAGALRMPGLLTFQPAMRRRNGTTELLLVSAWTDFEPILRSRMDLNQPIGVPRAASMVTHGHGDHFELLVGNAAGIPAAATLRLLRARLRPNVESHYFDLSRRIAEALVDDTRLLSVQMGRRLVRDGDEVVAVTLWADEASIAQVTGPDTLVSIGGEEIARLYAEKPTIEHFDAIIRAPGRRDAPAVLLADDERRFVFASERAAELTGRSVARLLTMRIDDLAAPSLQRDVGETWAGFLAAGSFEAPYLLRHQDGSDVRVHSIARARSPWPGCHATVLLPEGAEGSMTLDEALSAAGFVSRYAVASAPAVFGSNAGLG